MDCESMGQKLKANRVRQGWSLQTCSEKMGISPRYLADIERGDKTPKLETFIFMLNVLSASADEVLQDSLTVGYQAKSDDLSKRLRALDHSKQKQALRIFEGVIDSLKED